MHLKTVVIKYFSLLLYLIPITLDMILFVRTRQLPPQHFLPPQTAASIGIVFLWPLEISYVLLHTVRLYCGQNMVTQFSQYKKTVEKNSANP